MSVQDETWDRPICKRCGEEITHRTKSYHKQRLCPETCMAEIPHDLIEKAAEAMGAIRLMAGYLGLAGKDWNEEPGFTKPVIDKFLEVVRYYQENENPND